MQQQRIIFAGSGSFGLPTLRALGEQHQVVLVVTQPDRPAGRGRQLAPTPIAEYAQQRQLPLIRTPNIDTESLPAADLMVVVAFGQKIAPATVNHPRLGSINLHASRLPALRGAAPINWAIIRGFTTTGNSIIRLAERMDAGAILAQSELAIGETETAGELHDRLADDGAPLVLRVVQELAERRATEMPQDEAKATLAPKLRRTDARIDWSGSAAQVAGRIRGLTPWPGCHVRLLDGANQEHGRLTLLRARVGIGEGSRWHPGEIMTNLLVSVGDGTGGVEILEVQPEGKRPMPLASYRNGHPWLPGMRLESV